jgi:SAM-dependent methyltransferase
MKYAYRWNNIKWSLRKAAMPIKPSDLVLDVGSGETPHPSADVLLEKYVDPSHRYSPLVADRPTVLADACKMPFKDKAFDFVIAFHVLEHMRDPEQFIKELQRVGKAGYIETPNALLERLVPYNVHLLEVMNINDCLIINKKSAARPDPFLNNIELLANSPKWHHFFYNNPELFHARYLWNDKICFKIVNPETSSDWFQDPPIVEVDMASNAISEKRRIRDIRSLGLAFLKKWYRMRKRRTVVLEDLLACPECHGQLEGSPESFVCNACRVRYPRQPHADFNRPSRLF